MALPEIVSERVFTATDQIEFASLSGDWNPMHMDAVAARRTQAGSPVVHGVHAVAWALEAYAGKYGPLPSPILLNVRFDRFIYLDRSVEARLVEQRADGFLIALSVDGSRVATIRADAVPHDADAQTEAGSRAGATPLTAPRILDISDLAGDGGLVAVPATAEALSSFFPSLSREFGGAVGSLIALSALVGMYAPGLHSIFSKFSVRMTPAPGKDGLYYRVMKTQPMLRAIEIGVGGPGLRGSVGCFVRRPPVTQPATASLRGSWTPDCTGHRILIVGGSRGLGEVTAKLCALGGGDVTITYAVGSGDADAVRDDIVASGGRCESLRLDVNEPVGPQLEAAGGRFSHAYYFATSQIFRQKVEPLSPERLTRFLDIHLYGFQALCEALTTAAEPIKVFYPSSVAVDERPKDAIEYVIAKTAGEILSEALNALVPGLTILTERLPRTDTDQTATVLPVRSAAAADVMLPIIERMHTRNEA